MTDQGGFACPIPWCDHREYTPSMLDQHVTEPTLRSNRE